MSKSFQIALRRNPVFVWLKRQRDRRILRRWLQHPVPPTPYAYKRRLILDYAQRHQPRVLVETGTYFGDTTDAVRAVFDRVYSIELDVELHAGAARRFRQDRKVRLLQGDSGERIKDVLGEIREKALFWLDGHYSAGITAKGALETPILQELNHIFAHSVRDHVLLIDDARCFGVDADYPSIEQLEQHVRMHRPDAKIEVKDDIIRLEFSAGASAS
jgi:hypothetical protein